MQQALRLTTTVDEYRNETMEMGSQTSKQIRHFLFIATIFGHPQSHRLSNRLYFWQSKLVPLQLSDLPSRLKAIPTLQRQIQLPCGHSPHVECPTLLAEAIHECLRDNLLSDLEKLTISNAHSFELRFGGSYLTTQMWIVV